MKMRIYVHPDQHTLIYRLFHDSVSNFLWIKSRCFLPGQS